MHLTFKPSSSSAPRPGNTASTLPTDAANVGPGAPGVLPAQLQPLSQQLQPQPQAGQPQPAVDARVDDTDPLTVLANAAGFGRTEARSSPPVYGSASTDHQPDGCEDNVDLPRDHPERERPCRQYEDNTTPGAATGVTRAGSTSGTSSTSNQGSALVDGGTAPPADSDTDLVYALSPFIQAARDGDIIRISALLAQAATQVDEVDDTFGSTALMFAAQNGHADIVVALLAAGASVDFANHLGATTALMFAAMKDNALVVEILLAAGARVNASSVPNGETALMLACECGAANVVEVLLACEDIDVDVGGNSGMSAFMFAAANGRMDVAMRLIASGASTGMVSAGNGMNALLFACEAGHAGMVSLLLAHCSLDVNHADLNGRTALHHAAVKDAPAVVERLLVAGARLHQGVATHGLTPLMLAAQAGQCRVVALLLSQPGIEIDQVSEVAGTALHVAAAGNRPDVVRLLLAAGAKSDLSCGPDGVTPLFGAAGLGHFDIVRGLLEHSPTLINFTDSLGRSLLYFAVVSKQHHAVSMLLGLGASTKFDKIRSVDVLAEAARFGYVAVVETLLQHGAKVNDLAAFQASPTACNIAIVDLDADHRGLVAEWSTAGQTVPFFSKMADVLRDGGVMPVQRTWLDGQGMRMAVSRHLAELLAATDRSWPLQSSGSKPAEAQQRLLAFVGALSNLHLPAVHEKLVEAYLAAGVSAAAAERQSTAAGGQLQELGLMAGQAAAELGASMLDSLVAGNLARTGLNHEIDLIAFARSLVDEGFCAPIAQAIALAWKDAIASMHAKRFVIPDGLTMGQVLHFLREQAASRAPGEFALALRIGLTSRSSLSALQESLGGENDEGMHALFQIQCDQLRQFCEQLLDSSADTSNTSTTSNTASTSSTSTTANTSTASTTSSLSSPPRQ